MSAKINGDNVKTFLSKKKSEEWELEKVKEASWP